MPDPDDVVFIDIPVPSGSSGAPPLSFPRRSIKRIGRM